MTKKHLKSWLPFEKAKKFVHALNLNTEKKWRNYCKSGTKPANIPSTPHGVYHNEWKGWADWLGNDKQPQFKGEYMSFEEGRKFVLHLNIKHQREWHEYCKSGKRPKNLPANPSEFYKPVWKGWGYWLGSDRIANQNKQYYPFFQARKFVHSLKLKSRTEWRKYVKSGNKPERIPSNPGRTYESEWKGYGDWLGTKTIAVFKRVFRQFEEARKFARSLNLKSQNQWAHYCKLNKLPTDVPTVPRRVYKSEWKGWGDWLGTYRIANQNVEYRDFPDARAFARTIGLRGKEEWPDYCKSGKKPKDIPYNPSQVYKKEWTWWADWLGYEETTWSIRKVKELLRSIIENKLIYQWGDDEASLYRILRVNGLLNLQGNRHDEFFKNFVAAVQTREGLKAIEEYANSNSELPPDLSAYSNMEKEPNTMEQGDGAIRTASTSELTNLINQQKNEDPLDYNGIKTPEEILASTNAIESVTVDEETMQFLVSRSINKLWKSVFRRTERENYEFISTMKKNGNKYHDIVLDIFLKDYKGAQEIKYNLPKGYSFAFEPKLMQLYVAHKVNVSNYFGNFSGTGAGKTLSAVLASRVIKSKMTVVVCPNDVVEQWKNEIERLFPDSVVITGKEAFYARYDGSKYQYLVLNYDKFSQDYSSNLILSLARERIELVILDEVHYAKKRGGKDQEPSRRHRNLEGLLTAIRNRNKNKNNKIIVKVLGMSATPVINDLVEGKSLLEMITGKRYDDISTNPTIPNANTLFEKLSTISIREMPEYKAKKKEEDVEVIAEIPKDVRKQLKRNPLLIEQFLTEARIPEIIKRIKGKTIIYTEYVTGIIPKLKKAIANAGFTCTEYTGSFRDLKAFTDGQVQVLLASKPISTGLDGLQKVCNNLIINTLPWTNAQYQQLIGRLIRQGQEKNFVYVHIIKANLHGIFPYDQFIKWNRIEYKRTLADCAVDGRMPLKNLATPHQAHLEAIKWFERLMRNEVSTVTRRDLSVELTPVEIEKRVVKYGDFTRLNNKINNENSETTHNRMIKDPKEWDEYHRQYREARKLWPIVPYEEIIKRISQLSSRRLIGDFGCGEAKILEKFGAQRVFSFDHVAINNKVKDCDMKSVPLGDGDIDVAVFSLSLMGRNWPDYLKEAKRCLASDGYLLIAETTKSLKGRLTKLKEIIEKLGFDIYNEDEKGDFTFIEARELG